MSMKIEQRKTAEVIPYENNPRNNDEAVELVANSIKEFGFRSPIIVDGDGVIIAGHTRLRAAKSLGLETVPVIVAEDLTPEQVKAYRLADNKTAEKASWDFPLLAEELDGLSFDMTDFGFDFLGGADEDPEELPGKTGGREVHGGELDLGDFDADRFEHECPRCGFRFSD